jgi:hypothetical protein
MKLRPLHHRTFAAWPFAWIMDARLLAARVVLTLCLWIMNRRESVRLKATTGCPLDKDGERGEAGMCAEIHLTRV